MASFAVFIFAMVSIVILVANFKLNYAASTTSDAYDAFTSQLVEKNGIAEIVKESILAIRETNPSSSANPLQTEIQNRLSSMQFSPNVAVALNADNPLPSVPANPFYPNPVRPACSQPAYFSASGATRPVAGMGNLFTSLCMLGPAADLGRISLAFKRTDSAAPQENRAYTVDADLFSVPLTNVDVVAYGLPSSGTIPLAAPTVPPGFFGSDVSSLVVTSNNPSNDSTAFPDLFASSGAEQLPYQYRNAVSFSWNAYEYLWSSPYQNALLNAANGSIYNFAFPPDPSQPIPGVTPNGHSVTVDCSAVTGPILAIVQPSGDPQGIGSVTVTGSPSSGLPFILLIVSTAGAQIPVTFSGDNNRPAIFYLESASVVFSGNPQIQGALFLDPQTAASGFVTWFGHLSFYSPANPLGSLHITMADSPSVKAALADLAPRVLLVSTTATR